MRDKVVLIGPFPQPISGVSLANQVLEDGLRRKNYKLKCINTENQNYIGNEIGKFHIKKINFIKFYFQFYKVLTAQIVYITIGQSFFGVVKYLPFLLLGKALGKKTVIHLHGGHLLDNYNAQKGVKKAIMLATLKLFDKGICLSQGLKPQLEFFLLRKDIFSVPNFYQNALHENSMQKKDFSKLKILYLSNLIESKGINVLLKAMKQVEKECEVELCVAGNIPVENGGVEELMKHVDSCKYFGVVQGEQKARLLQWANVFCLPTYYPMEGQPISIIEAMSFGNLILTTRHGGIMDICKDENAVFVNKKDSVDLGNSILLLAKDLERVNMVGDYNLRYASNRFTEEKFVNNIEEVFKNV